MYVVCAFALLYVVSTVMLVLLKIQSLCLLFLLSAGL
jgi:hypothetical protein